MERQRRVSPRTYKLLLTIHVLFSAIWLGIVVAKLVLGIAATATHHTRVTDALAVSMDALNVAFPPMAVGTLLSGVILSLGTKWGLLAHYWVLAKLLLTVGLITTAARFDFVPHALSALSGEIFRVSAALRAGPELNFLIYLSAAHVLMLGTATVISIYKPFGKISLRKT